MILVTDVPLLMHVYNKSWLLSVIIQQPWEKVSFCTHNPKHEEEDIIFWSMSLRRGLVIFC